MFSKEESKKIRQEFWTNFGKKYPRKWLLYNTKIKEVQLKFTFTNDIAQVSLDIISDDELITAYYLEKILALKSILIQEYLANIVIDTNYILPEGKSIARLYVQKDNVNIHNRNHWEDVSEFLNENMTLLEMFFIEYKDYIES